MSLTEETKQNVISSYKLDWPGSIGLSSQLLRRLQQKDFHI